MLGHIFTSFFLFLHLSQCRKKNEYLTDNSSFYDTVHLDKISYLALCFVKLRFSIFGNQNNTSFFQRFSSTYIHRKSTARL